MATLGALFVAAQLVASTPEPQTAVVAWIVEGEFCEPETVLALPDNTLLVSNVCVSRPVGEGYLTLIDAHVYH